MRFQCWELGLERVWQEAPLQNRIANLFIGTERLLRSIYGMLRIL